MVAVGALAGSLAAKIMKSDLTLVVSMVLGIGGAVVGGFIFNILGLTPGAGVAKALSTTFNVDLPTNFIGMIISATVGSLIILFGVKTLRGGIGKGRK